MQIQLWYEDEDEADQEMTAAVDEDDEDEPLFFVKDTVQTILLEYIPFEVGVPPQRMEEILQQLNESK